jgi:hypothetical protein
MRLEADVPASDRMEHAAVCDALDAFLDATEDVEDLAPHAHWLTHPEHEDDFGDDDGSGSYCPACAEARHAVLVARHPLGEDECLSDGWLVGGGCDREDGPTCCGGCGRMLRWSASDTSAPDEMAALEAGYVVAPEPAHHAYCVRQLAEWARWLDPTRLGDMRRVEALCGAVDVEAVATSLPGEIASLDGTGSPDNRLAADAGAS